MLVRHGLIASIIFLCFEHTPQDKAPGNGVVVPCKDMVDRGSGGSTVPSSSSRYEYLASADQQLEHSVPALF